MRVKILQILNHADLELPPEINRQEVIYKITEFLGFWRKWNQKINLTSEKDEEKVLERHIFDSLQYARAINPKGKIIDIGSGSGFPGIPLKIIFPGLDLTLVESRRKRVSFLRELIRGMKLEKIEVVNARAEDLGKKEEFHRQFDAVLFRAVGKLEYCIEIGEPFLAESGKIIVMKEMNILPKSISNKMGDKFRIVEENPVKNFNGVGSTLLSFGKVPHGTIEGK